MKSFLPAALVLLLGCGDDDSSARPDDASTPDASKADSGAPPTRDAEIVPVDSGSKPDDGGGDAASVDARTFEAGIEAGDAAVVGCTGLKFCDDFEDAQLGSGWTGKQGTLELDATKALRGQKSLHAHTVNGQPAIVAHRASFPMPNERFWVRMFVNIESLPTVDWAHWSLLWVIPEGQQWSVVEHRIGGQNQSDDKLYWGVGSDHGASGDWTNIDTSSTVQLDEWQCVEVFIDATDDITKVYRESVEIPGMGTTRTVKHGGNSGVPYDIPAVRALYIGFIYYQGETPNKEYDLWIDGFALDGERIGCER
jgi:hypothetical protein